MPTVAEIVIRVSVPLPREDVWRRLWDPARHTGAIPLTVVSSPPSMAAVGARVTARTAIGAWGFDDTMTVTGVVDEGPGPWACRLVKTGRVVRGTVAATVTACPGHDGAPGTDLVWRQRLTIRGLPAAADPVVAAVAWAGYRAALRRIVGA